MNRLIFLGTGGGKNVMFTQVRKTGGIFVELDETKLILDPGPGSLANAQHLKLHPEHWHAVLLSHLHPDHVTDANVYIDGMKESVLVAEEHCVLPGRKWNREKYEYYPCITAYHAKKAKDVHPVNAGDTAQVMNVAITAVQTDHYDPTVGFVISGSTRIGYPSDGTYFRGQEKHYDGCDLLVLNVLVPSGVAAKKHWHMGVDDAILMIQRMKKKPQLVIIQHFSFSMLRAGVQAQAALIQKKTGVRCVAAEDFMQVGLDTMSLQKISRSRDREGPWLRTARRADRPLPASRP